MKRATFVNITEKPFTGYWDGRKYTFQAGQKKEGLNSEIARHFAKHLTNQILNEKNMPQYCSPKKMEEVPQFKNIFDKIFFLENDGQEIDPETGMVSDDMREIEAPSMDIKVIPRTSVDPYDANAQPQTGPGEKSQVIDQELGDDDDADFETNDDQPDAQ